MFVKYQTPYLANAVFFVAFFLMGVLISYFFSLFKHFKDGKTIKSLKAKESSLVETVATLEKQLADQKPSVVHEPEAPVEDEPVERAVEMK